MEAVSLSPSPVPPLDEAILRALGPLVAAGRGAGDALDRQVVLAVLDLVRAALNARREAGAPPATPFAPRASTATRAVSHPAATLSVLTPREREVLRHIADGRSNKVIARALSLSPHTVKRHVGNILDKLDARTRAQAAALWAPIH